MARSRTTTGLAVAALAAFSFGMSGAFVKPMLEAGWSPAAAVTVRALVGGIVLAPFAALSLRGRWQALWNGRWRILAMALVGVGGCQLAYFAAIERIPVGTAILLEYMAPLLLVGVVWARTRRRPESVVLIGSIVAVAGLALVVAPGSGVGLDALGLLFAALATVGCAIYYLVAAAPGDGLPAVALAASGLLLGGLALGLIGLTGLVPFTTSTDPVDLFGTTVAWWAPVLVVGFVATALAYTANITGSEMLGARLASFAGLLEVVAATFYAWILLGEDLTLPQLIGGGLILVGIGFVRSAKERDVGPAVAPGASVPAVDPTPTAPLRVV